VWRWRRNRRGREDLQRLQLVCEQRDEDVTRADTALVQAQTASAAVLDPLGISTEDADEAVAERLAALDAVESLRGGTVLPSRATVDVPAVIMLVSGVAAVGTGVYFQQWRRSSSAACSWRPRSCYSYSPERQSGDSRRRRAPVPHPSRSRDGRGRARPGSACGGHSKRPGQPRARSATLAGTLPTPSGTPISRASRWRRVPRSGRAGWPSVDLPTPSRLQRRHS